MTDKQISEILEEEGYSFTDNLEESVFILKNGNLEMVAFLVEIQGP